jgi:hypothetical protein
VLHILPDLPMLTLDRLPREIHLRILAHVTVKELVNCMRLSHEWCNRIVDPLLWKRVCFKEEYQDLDVQYWDDGRDVFLHTNLEALEEHSLHPLKDIRQELLLLIKEKDAEKDARALFWQAKKGNHYLKAIVLSPTLHKLVLTYVSDWWIGLLRESISTIPEIVPVLLYNIDFQQVLLAEPLSRYDLRDILKQSEKGTCLLLKDPRLLLLKQQLFPYNAHDWPQCLITKYPKVAALIIEDQELMAFLSISLLKLITEQHPQLFSFLKNENRLEGIHSTNLRVYADYWLFITHHQDQPIQTQFHALQCDRTIALWLKSQQCGSLRAFLMKILLPIGKESFRTVYLKDFSSLDDSKLVLVQVVLVKETLHIEYLVSSIHRDVVSKEWLTLPELIRLTPEQYSAVPALVDFLSLKQITLAQFREITETQCMLVNRLHQRYTAAAENLSSCVIQRLVRGGSLSFKKALTISPETLEVINDFELSFEKVVAVIDQKEMGDITISNFITAGLPRNGLGMLSQAGHRSSESRESSAFFSHRVDTENPSHTRESPRLH